MAQNFATPGAGRAGIKFVMGVPIGPGLDQGLLRWLHDFCLFYDFFITQSIVTKSLNNCLS
jgi:hypothetical protein